MRRQKKNSKINGLLLIDKPVGLTSHDVVHRVRRILKTSCVGHTGTLDPMASGLMVLLIGEATKLSRYILEGNKGYDLCFELGKETDTLDITGKILQEKPVSIDKKKLSSAINDLQGRFHWPVPLYSATKVNGKKLYEYARSGESVELPQKEMNFWDVQIQETVHEASDTQGRVTLSCSKGSYVRTWVHELGKRLGCGAVLTNLRRFYCEPYELNQAVSLKTLEEFDEPNLLQNLQARGTFIEMSQALPHWRSCSVSGHNERLLCNGQISTYLKQHLGSYLTLDDEESDFKVLSSQRRDLLALIHFTPQKGFKIIRIFPQNS